jgi:hypothetical protein
VDGNDTTLEDVFSSDAWSRTRARDHIGRGSPASKVSKVRG